MLILITNDDSIEAPGLHFLVDCVKDLGEVYVVAPAVPHSGQSSAFTVNAPLRIKEHEGYHGARVFSVNGTPVDCVKLSMHHILPRKPDLLLSGVNHGSNAGNSVIYSGTMGAAFEACMQGDPRYRVFAAPPFAEGRFQRMHSIYQGDHACRDRKRASGRGMPQCQFPG